MKILNLAIDCDDVLTPTAEWITEAYNSKYGTHVALENFYSADPDIWQTSSIEEASARFGSIQKTSEYAEMRPFNSAIESVLRLAQQHKLHLVTGRAAYLEPVTSAMIDTYFPLCFESVNHTGYYEGEKKGKADICIELGIDVLVDDHSVHLEDVKEAGLKEAILFGNYPWNQVMSSPSNMTRCLTWTEVEQEIERIARK